MRKKLSLLVLVFAALLQVQAAPPNKVLNPKFVNPVSGDPTKAANWPAVSFLPGGYTRVKYNGVWTARLQNGTTSPRFAGACQSVSLRQTVPLPVKVTAKLNRQGIQNVSSDFYGANLYVEITYMNPGVPVFYGPPWEMFKYIGTFGLQTIGFNTATLPAPWKGEAIDAILVCPMLGQVSGKAWFRNVSVQQYQPFPGALFAMVLDDGTISQYNERSIFTSRRIPATVAGVSSYLEPGPDHDPDYMDVWQLEELIDTHGWRVISHSHTHKNLATLSTDTAIRAELRASKQFFNNWGMPTNDFALPFGAYNGRTLGLAQQEGYRSVRNVWRSLNYAGTVPWDIRAFEIKSGTTLDEFKSWVDAVIVERAALVVFTHKIEPVACPAGNDYCTTRSFLEAAMDYVLQKSGQGFLTIKTYPDLVTAVIQ